MDARQWLNNMEVTEVNEVMWPLATKLKTIVMTRKTIVDHSVNFNNFERSDNFKNINSNMKKEYMMPQMEAVKIQQTQMLCSSPGAKGLSNADGFVWTDGLDGDDN